ncbi:NADPH-dependent F420 reductase [Sphingobium sp. DEHP117]|uniref:NADPH-dependent F420 reductase n=1 Tax=Sphingobium sp. DEHP117 TaxID=2993436 RepID=UPI0027D6FC43|nr:NADPH-dependent F420 reductase [Sphingobium sp. DEHP117]MDQ4420362.1 NADPH-dependent F420 reductase [Sphingobium sp. DEHP117]
MLGTIAVIGGTGNLGAALARRWAKSGLTVILGSRSAAGAQEKAAELGFGLSGAANADAAAQADIIVVTVPWSAQEATLREIAPHVAGKLVVDTTVPLVPPKVMRVQLPVEGSAAVRAEALLGGQGTLVSAFHSVAAHKLATDEEVDCDVLVFGDDKAARTQVIELARHAGLRGLHAGALVNSAAAEALTSILIFMNKSYNLDGAGIRITGKLTNPEP